MRCKPTKRLRLNRKIRECLPSTLLYFHHTSKAPVYTSTVDYSWKSATKSCKTQILWGDVQRDTPEPKGWRKQRHKGPWSPRYIELQQVLNVAQVRAIININPHTKGPYLLSSTICATVNKTLWQDCYNKLPQAWWLKTMEIYSLTLLEARNSKSASQGWNQNTTGELPSLPFPASSSCQDSLATVICGWMTLITFCMVTSPSPLLSLYHISLCLSHKDACGCT